MPCSQLSTLNRTSMVMMIQVPDYTQATLQTIFYNYAFLEY